jgi:hypothetical protein
MDSPAEVPAGRDQAFPAGNLTGPLTEVATARDCRRLWRLAARPRPCLKRAQTARNEVQEPAWGGAGLMADVIVAGGGRAGMMLAGELTLAGVDGDCGAPADAGTGGLTCGRLPLADD